MKARNILMQVAAAIVLVGTPCFGDLQQYPTGFHNGGTASCDGCHVKTTNATFSNNSTAGSSGSKPNMLNGSDASSTCLLCHAAPLTQEKPSEIYVATQKKYLVGGIPPTQLTPGGDFGWLLKTYKWSSRGSAVMDEASPGEIHGHNVVAQDYDFISDFNYTTAPGGTYPADKLSCVSCHDPHGYYRRNANGSIKQSGPPVKASGSYRTSPEPDEVNSVGTYRMLAGQGYQPKSISGDFAFKADPPVAVSPNDFNRAETGSDTRVAYGSGMTEWCRNCHVTTHLNGHPMGDAKSTSGRNGKLTDNVIKAYNRYISSGKHTGSAEKAYNSLVPFEMGTADYATLKAVANNDGSNNSGPKTGANVMCLTCHRAHASAWDYSLRWNNRSGLIVFDSKFVGTDTKAPPNMAQGRLSIETRRAFYDRGTEAFGAGQRSLCSKCHEKD